VSPTRKNNTSGRPPEHFARKRFGQNFLHDPSIIDAIIQHINPQADQHIVEIGPGLGALTMGLSEGADKLSLIELDRDLILGLQLSFEKKPVDIYNEDALKFDFSRLGSVGRPLRLVGNLPYKISTPLIFHLLEQSNIIRDMHFMLQKEVVDRICAPAGSKAYGRLSIMVQYHCEVESLLEVGPGAFNPPPKVKSGIIRLTPRAPKLAAVNPQHLSKLVTQAFSQRRKTIRNTLKGMVAEGALENLGIDPSARPETLLVRDYVALSNAIQN